MPNEAILFLSVDEAIAIHERLIERFSGAPGIRDKGLLESALFRPQTGYYKDIAELAAALFESLILNHAFIDGKHHWVCESCKKKLKIESEHHDE